MYYPFKVTPPPPPHSRQYRLEERKVYNLLPISQTTAVTTTTTTEHNSGNFFGILNSALFAPVSLVGGGGGCRFDLTFIYIGNYDIDQHHPHQLMCNFQTKLLNI